MLIGKVIRKELPKKVTWREFSVKCKDLGKESFRKRAQLPKLRQDGAVPVRVRKEAGVSGVSSLDMYLDSAWLLHLLPQPTSLAVVLTPKLLQESSHCSCPKSASHISHPKPHCQRIFQNSFIVSSHSQEVPKAPSGGWALQFLHKHLLVLTTSQTPV